MPEDLITGLPASWRQWTRGGVRPVLASHCSLAHSGVWSGLADLMRGVTLTAIDQPGHGRSADWSGQEDLHALTTRMLVDAAETLGGGGRIDLLGHSFGATVALRIALDRPDLVRSLTLIEPVIFAAARGDAAYAPFRARHLQVAALLQGGDLSAAVTEFHADWGAGTDFADLPDRQRQYMLDRIHLIGAQNAALVDDAAGLLRPGGLEALDVPVLLIEGAQSPPIISAVQAALAGRLKRVQRLAVAGAGHMVPITHAASVAPMVQAHLDGC